VCHDTKQAHKHLPFLLFRLSNFEVEALLFYASAGVWHARWGFSVSLTTWAKFHVHLEDEYSATDYYRTLFICKGSPLHNNPQEQIKTRSHFPLLRVLPADMLSAIKQFADEMNLSRANARAPLLNKPLLKKSKDVMLIMYQFSKTHRVII
jgi:hypothetical protein